MGIEYKIMPECSAVVVKVTGALTKDRVLDHLSQLKADPSVPVDHVTLFDATEVSSMELSEDDIAEIIAFTIAGGPKIIAKRHAILTRGDRETSLAKEYEHLASRIGENTIVFFHFDTACKWLGIPPGSLG